MEERTEFTLKYHYHLFNQSHSMSVDVLHSCDEEILRLLGILRTYFPYVLEIEREALAEGGVKEVWKFLGDNVAQISIIVSILTLLLTFLPKTDPEMDKLQKQNLQLQNEKLALELEELRKKKETDKISEQDVQNLNKDSGVVVHRSRFYEKLQNYSKIEYFETVILDHQRTVVFEQRISHSDFPKYVRNRTLLPKTTMPNVLVRVVSPVFLEGKYKWKGIIEGKVVDFSVSDKKFRADVKAKAYTFSSATYLRCDVVIHRVLDEAGYEKNRGYSIKKVYAVIEGDLTEKLTPAGFKKRNLEIESTSQISMDFEATKF